MEPNPFPSPGGLLPNLPCEEARKALDLAYGDERSVRMGYHDDAFSREEKKT